MLPNHHSYFHLLKTQKVGWHTGPSNSEFSAKSDVQQHGNSEFSTDSAVQGNGTSQFSADSAVQEKDEHAICRGGCLLRPLASAAVAGIPAFAPSEFLGSPSATDVCELGGGGGSGVPGRGTKLSLPSPVEAMCRALSLCMGGAGAHLSVSKGKT